ncbi:hypothetical protein H5997_04850 [Megamonas hypermegale]|nr:hypothetical protein [Megamonas hypermegale]
MWIKTEDGILINAEKNAYIAKKKSSSTNKFRQDYYDWDKNCCLFCN